MKMNEISGYSSTTIIANWLTKFYKAEIYCITRNFFKDTGNLFWELNRKNSIVKILFSPMHTCINEMLLKKKPFELGIIQALTHTKIKCKEMAD